MIHSPCLPAIQGWQRCSALTVNGNISGDNSGADYASITMRGNVHLAVDSAWALGNDTNASVEGIFLGDATVSSIGGSHSLTLNTTSAPGTSGAITLGRFDDSGGDFVQSLSLNTNGSGPSDGTISVAGGVITYTGGS